MSVKALLFDCFGVIRPDRLAAAYAEMGGDYAADLDFIEHTQRAANMGLIDGSRFVFAERLGISVETWMQALDRGADIDNVLLDYIADMRATYKTAILSNASRGRLQDVVGADNLQRCFDVVVESGSLGFAKPDREIYEYTADSLDVRYDECVFTDDRIEYCEAARSVGMQAIHYQSFAQFRQQLSGLILEP